MDVPPTLPEPGLSLSCLGYADATVFLAAHLAYGATFGLAYATLTGAGA